MTAERQAISRPLSSRPPIAASAKPPSPDGRHPLRTHGRDTPGFNTEADVWQGTIRLRLFTTAEGS